MIGQSDIKKLRRENEQLRREIWSLREEYDKLDNLLRHGRSNESDNSQSDSVYFQYKLYIIIKT